MEEPMSDQLLSSKHALFCYRSLKFLPTPYQVEDSNRMALAYFCLSSLSLLPATALSATNDPTLSALDVLLKPEQRKRYIDWVYEQQVPSGGFRGSDSLKGSEPPELKETFAFIPLKTRREQDDFDKLMDYPDSDDDSNSELGNSPKRRSDHALAPANLIQSYTAILILGILGDDFSRLDRDGLRRFIARCQCDDGTFLQFPECQELGDPRSTYSAFVLASLIDDWSAIEVDSALAFLSRCQQSDGGFATRPGLEAQGGTTYCSIASYSLASRLSSLSNPKAVLRWLVHRQIEPAPSSSSSSSSSSASNDEDQHRIRKPVTGKTRAGFQGRPSKPPDACYSFWCTASLSILSESDAFSMNANSKKGRFGFYDVQKDREWLLSCQHTLFGGIAREQGNPPDVYHTYLSLAALSIGQSINYPERDGVHLGLERLDPNWNVSLKVKEALKAKLHAIKN